MNTVQTITKTAILLLLTFLIIAEAKAEEFRKVNKKGTDIVCIPQLNKLTITGRNLSATNQAELDYLLKDRKQIHDNGGKQDVLTAMGDVRYRCDLQDSRLLVEVTFNYRDDWYTEWRKDWKKGDKEKKYEKKQGEWNPHMLPHKTGSLWYTHHLRIWSLDASTQTLMVDINQFNGESVYLTSLISVKFKQDPSLKKYNDVFVFESQLINYSMAVQPTLWLKSSAYVYYKNETIDNDYIFNSFSKSWGSSSAGLGSRRLTHRTEEICDKDLLKDKKVSYRVACKQYFDQQKYIINFLQNKHDQKYMINFLKKKHNFSD